MKINIPSIRIHGQVGGGADVDLTLDPFSVEVVPESEPPSDAPEPEPHPPPEPEPETPTPEPEPEPTPEPQPEPTPVEPIPEPVEPSPSPKPRRRRLGFNMDFIYSPEAFTFADRMRVSQPWVSGTWLTWNDGREVQQDPYGNVLGLAPGQHALSVVPTHRLAGPWELIWEGRGSIELGQVDAVLEREPGRIVFRGHPTEREAVIRVTAGPVYWPSLRLVGDLGESWDRTFLKTIGPSSCLRFMQWGLINGDDVSVGNQEQEWAARQPSTRVSQRPKVSYEHMINLCNDMLQDLWLCVPHLASDDYVRQLGALVEERLDPSLKVYLEWSNEVWNGMFRQHGYASSQGVAAGLAGDAYTAHLRYTGRRSQEIWALFEAAAGRRPVRVLGAQCPDRGGRDDGTEEWAMNRLVDEVSGFDAFAVAPYFGGGNWGYYSMAPADQILEQLSAVAVPRVAVDMKVARRMADKYGVDLLGYEGGQHLASPDPGQTPGGVVQKLLAVNRDPRMYDIYRKWLSAWDEAGGGLLCHYTLCGSWNHFGTWGALERSDQSPSTAHKYRALVDWELLG